MRFVHEENGTKITTKEMVQRNGYDVNYRERDGRTRQAGHGEEQDGSHGLSKDYGRVTRRQGKATGGTQRRI